MKNVCIFGAGGSARETSWIARRCGYHVEALLDICGSGFYNGIPILPDTFFDGSKHLAVVAVGNPILRKKIAENILSMYGDVFISLIDPSVITLSPNIKIGKGAVIAPQCVLTSDINIGNFCRLNVATSIMHDVRAGDFFTTAPGVIINGKVKIGDMVYFGSNSIVKEEIIINNHITIGAGTCVVKDIIEGGIYVGVPARKLVK